MSKLAAVLLRLIPKLLAERNSVTMTVKGLT